MLTQPSAISWKFVGKPYDLNSILTPDGVWEKLDLGAEEVRQSLITLINELQSVVDASSGADNVGMTPITVLGAQTTVQAIVEALVTRLQATTDSASGADLIGATGISGLSGASVQALLESLKSYVDSQTPLSVLNGSITDLKLSDVTGDIKQRFNAHLAETTQYLSPTGGADDTAFLQDKLNSFPHVTLRPGIYYIDAVTKLTPPANRTIVFMAGAVLQCITNSSDSYRVLELLNENIRVIDPYILGDRNTHTGTTGEQGHGIYIGNANNIIVTNPTVKNCWGDGIYILNRSGKITIDNPVCDNNRRQGISIISADDLTINSPSCSNTNGTPPEAGIDIEPSFVEDVFNSIKINNPYTYNNVGAGITINLAMMKGTNKSVSINILNHVDKLSVIGFTCNNNQAGVSGKITNKNPFYEKSQGNGIYIRSCEAVGTPTIEIDNPIVLNPNESNSSASTGQNGIFIHRPLGDVGTNPIGNVLIKNPKVLDNRATSQTVRGIYFRDEKDITAVNLKIIDPLEISGIANTTFKIVINPGGVYLSDRYKTNVLDIAVNTTLSAYYSEITNSSAAALSVAVLSYPLIVDTTIKFTNKNSFGLAVQPEVGTSILPLSSVAGKWIKTVEIGASVTLRKISSTQYYIDNMIGTWTVQA